MEIFQLMEKINLNNPDEINIPDALMIRPKLVAVFDNIKDTINIFFRNPFGTGNHQINSDATKVNRKPINKKGGSSTIAGFAITKPKPKKIGTSVAKNVSLRFKIYSH